MKKAKVNIHRIKGRDKEPLQNIIFPVAKLRRDLLLKDADFGAPEELPDLVDTSDDEDEKVEPKVVGSFPKGETLPEGLSPKGAPSHQ